MDAKGLLVQAGWTPGRDVDVSQALAALTSAGHMLVEPAERFLREFSGLTVFAEGDESSVRIDGLQAARRADPEWCTAYAKGIGSSVTPVGEQSHMTLLLADDGSFWGGYDDLYGRLGASVLDVIDCLLVRPPSQVLSREVDD